jgi:hypothetical protein
MYQKKEGNKLDIKAQKGMDFGRRPMKAGR